MDFSFEVVWVEAEEPSIVITARVHWHLSPAATSHTTITVAT